MPRKKKILILGGEGFIGRNIAAVISKNYDCYSVGIEKSIFSERKDKYKKADPYKKKIKNDYDTIIHLIDIKENIDKFEDYEKKLIKNINLNSKNYLILFSSAVVYASPNSDYGKRKLALEKIYKDYCKKNKIKLLILRLFNIYGPYQFPYKQGSLVANIFCNFLNGATTEINDFKAKRDFIYSVDMARAVEWVINNKVEGINDLATNREVLLKDLIADIKDVIKGKINIKDNNVKENVECCEAKSSIIKNIRLIKIKKGLAKTFNFYKTNIEIINGKKYGQI